MVTNKSNAQERMFQTFTDMMIREIEDISKDWKRPWLTDGAIGMPRSLDGREYNGTNLIFLWLTCKFDGYKYPIFATFDAIRKLNDEDTPRDEQVHVMKGETALPVYFYLQVIRNDKHERITIEEYEQMSLKEKLQCTKHPSLRVYNVFNISQTNMQDVRPDLWEKYTQENAVKTLKTDGFTFEPLDNIIASQSWHCPITCKENSEEAYYSITQDKIVIPTHRQFPHGEDFAKTAFHEMAHSTGKKSMLDRFSKDNISTTEYAREELVAELTAALTALQYGMQSRIKKDSAAYLKSWLACLHETPDFIKTVLADVRKANKVLKEAIDKEITDEKARVA